MFSVALFMFRSMEWVPMNCKAQPSLLRCKLTDSEEVLMRVEDLIGDNVRERRERIGMTQEEFGKTVETYLGRSWTRQAVSAAENGRRDWRAEDLIAAALVLRISPTYLLQPKLNDVLELPGKAVSFDDMISQTITKDSSRLAAARDSVDLLRRVLDEVADQVENARQKAGFAAAMFEQAKRRAKK